jgi:hypothetical protein
MTVILKKMGLSKSKAALILLLLCAALMPLTVYGGRAGGGGGGGGGGGIGGGGGAIGGGGGIGGGGQRPIPPGGGGGMPGGGMPGGGQMPTFANQPTVNLPTARPTVAVSFTRSIGTSFSFAQSSWTGISITRTVATSYTFNPTFTMTTTGYNYPNYGAGGFVFNQYPPNYNSNVGSFTLDQSLDTPNGVPCVYYADFQFNANAGQSLQAKLWTQGTSINYVIVPLSLFQSLQQAGCSHAAGNQQQTFNSQISLNWTAPQTGQYAIVFYSFVPYTGPIYFLPGS